MLVFGGFSAWGLQLYGVPHEVTARRAPVAFIKGPVRGYDTSTLTLRMLEICFLYTNLFALGIHIPILHDWRRNRTCPAQSTTPRYFKYVTQRKTGQNGTCTSRCFGSSISVIQHSEQTKGTWLRFILGPQRPTPARPPHPSGTPRSPAATYP